MKLFIYFPLSLIRFTSRNCRMIIFFENCVFLQSDSELFVESYSEDEDGPVCTMKRLPSSNDVFDDNGAPLALGEIRSLIERKEELERKQRKQDRHRQRVQVSGKKASTVARDRLSLLRR